MENTLCKYCVKFLPSEKIEQGKITCKNCLEYKRNQYAKHKERYNEKERMTYKKDEKYRKIFVKELKSEVNILLPVLCVIVHLLKLTNLDITNL